MKIRGTIHGKTIELETDPGIPDGQVVEIVLRVLKPAEAAGDGIRRSAGIAADVAGIDEAFEQVQADRQAARLSDDANAVGRPPSPAPVELPLAAGVASEWVIAIHPLTHKAAETLPDQGLLVYQFPLRIGRASDGREAEASELNDLWLLDQKPYHVSRNHCEIVIDDGGPMIRDRGSHLGCVVNDTLIGGRAAVDSARLEPGENVVVLGTRMSRYQFRVVVRPG